MKIDTSNGIVMLGCGKMGGAILEGWLANGVPTNHIQVIDINPSDRIKELSKKGLLLNTQFGFNNPAMVMLAVKPQMMKDAISSVQHFISKKTVFVSIAAGTRIDFFEQALPKASIIRTMPNTPAAVGRGLTALFANNKTSEYHKELTAGLMSMVGDVIWLEEENQMDIVTAVSGSGPAYVFHMIEAMAAAAESAGLPKELAYKMARATVCGAGELAYESSEPASQLRINVTSPMGTTAAALEVLMDDKAGLTDLMTRGVAAAKKRSEELAG